MRANWKRGAFRIWVVVSVFWCIAVAIFFSNELYASFSSHHVIYVKMSNTETLEYPNELGADAIKADLTKRIDVANAENKKWAANVPAARKAECGAIPSTTPFDKQPEDCVKLFFTDMSDLAVPTDWQTQVTRFRPVMPLLLKVLLLALVPPLLIFALGLALAWALAGFRPAAK